MTGLLDLLLRTSERTVTVFLETAASKAARPGDVLAGARTVTRAAIERARVASRSVLARFDPSASMDQVFAVLLQGNDEGWRLVADISAGKATRAEQTMRSLWQKHRAGIQSSLGEFRRWASSKGIDQVREAMYEAIVLANEGLVPETKEPVPRS